MTDATPTPTAQDRSSLEGTTPDLTDDTMRAKAIEAAFDYRGDVTIDTEDGRTIEGYIFNRKADADPPHIVMMLAGGGQETIRFDAVRRLAFTGRDTAAGKSFDTWIKKYIEKKLKGESANIESEALD